MTISRRPYRSGLCGWATCADDRIGDSMFCPEHHLRAMAAGCPQILMRYNRDTFSFAMDWSNDYEDRLAGRKPRESARSAETAAQKALANRWSG